MPSESRLLFHVGIDLVEWSRSASAWTPFYKPGMGNLKVAFRTQIIVAISRKQKDAWNQTFLSGQINMNDFFNTEMM